MLWLLKKTPDQTVLRYLEMSNSENMAREEELTFECSVILEMHG